MKRNKYVEKVVGNYQGPEKERKKRNVFSSFWWIA